MENNIFYLLFILLNITTAKVFCQTNFDKFRHWDKIILIDAHAGHLNYSNEYQITHNNKSLTLLNKPDSAIKFIDVQIIDSLLHIIEVNNKLIEDDPLLMYNRDSLWLINNADLLWKNFNINLKKTNKIDSIAINAIKDYSKVKPLIWHLVNNNWTDDYPLVHLQIINNTDTLNITSMEQPIYMLPWNVGSEQIYNSNIASLISELIPENKYSNKLRLSGKDFNLSLMSVIFHYLIEKEVEKEKIRTKYFNQFQKLEEHFVINNAEIAHMSSIEWGGWFGKPCLQLQLLDTFISNHIRFDAIYRKNYLFFGPKTIIKNKNKLISRLQNNPVYVNTLNCKQCVGTIHWVKSKSLSREAKHNFYQNLNTNGQLKSSFKGKFRNAIFYELQNSLNSERNFSRWIFLKDGTIILWELVGNTPNFISDRTILNTGYICKTISLKDFTNLPPSH